MQGPGSGQQRRPAPMKLSAELRAFEERIGYTFRDPAILREALTHASMSSPTRADNQRLEFLGDRVLGLVIAETVLNEDIQATEGQLAPRFNALVRKEACADVARTIDLGPVLRLGRSEMNSGGRRKKALLGDAMEAVIAAVFLDGGLPEARAMIRRLWGARISQVDHDARDSKTILQEWAQARGMPPPAYREIARAGPDHAPRFTIEVCLQNGQSVQAEAGSKRLAEQGAASALLGKIGEQT